MIVDIVQMRMEISHKLREGQHKQKQYYDKKRKVPRKYKIGDLVLLEKAEIPEGRSRKLLQKYSGPMIIKKVLPNDKYVVRDMEDNHRTQRKSKYERVIAVDKIKPWGSTGDLSESTDDESGEDGIVLSDTSDLEEEGVLEDEDSQDGRL